MGHSRPNNLGERGMEALAPVLSKRPDMATKFGSATMGPSLGNARGLSEHATLETLHWEL